MDLRRGSGRGPATVAVGRRILLGGDPRRDRRDRADDVRPVHGDRAVRPGARLLPGTPPRDRAARATSSRRPRPARSSAGRSPGSPAAVHAALGAPARSRSASTAPGPGALAGAARRRRCWPAERRPPGGSATSSMRSSRTGSPRSGRGRGAAGDAAGSRSNPTTARPIDGLVVANEVLDALPTHRVVGRGGGAPRGPGRARTGRRRSSTSRASRRRPASPPGSPPRIVLADGQRGRDLPRARRLGRARGRRASSRGVLLLIDYGHPAAELYDPAGDPPGRSRPTTATGSTTTRTVAIGRQDLTAHVDVTARRTGRRRRRARATSGRRPRRSSSPASASASCSSPSRPGRARPSRRYLETRSALVRMIDPARWAASGSWPSGAAWPDGTVAAGPRSDDAIPAAGRPTRANALLPRRVPGGDAPQVPGDGAHRRGADRELARALGAIRSPINLATDPRRRSRSPSGSRGAPGPQRSDPRRDPATRPRPAGRPALAPRWASGSPC